MKNSVCKEIEDVPDTYSQYCMLAAGSSDNRNDCTTFVDIIFLYPYIVRDTKGVIDEIIHY
jgi:hypothetical protein